MVGDLAVETQQRFLETRTAAAWTSGGMCSSCVVCGGGEVGSSVSVVQSVGCLREEA